MDKLVADIRVKSLAVKPHEFHDKLGQPLEPVGEVNQVKASGWLNEEDHMEVSIHFEAPVGCGVVPFLGDYIRVTIERVPAVEYQTLQVTS